MTGGGGGGAGRGAQGGGRIDRLGGLVLAGGGSTRFGSDKALAVVDGTTLLDRAIACLREVCGGPVLVASGAGGSRYGVGDGEVADVDGAVGPLAGIAAGLEALADDTAAVAVLAVDHVTPSAALLRLLAAAGEEAPGPVSCALVEADGWPQPLHAVWSTTVADELGTAVRTGERSPTAWLARRDDVVVVGEATLQAAGIDPAVTQDVDAPDDLPDEG